VQPSELQVEQEGSQFWQIVPLRKVPEAQLLQTRVLEVQLRQFDIKDKHETALFYGQ
jgi:hypothetical protein